MVESVFNLIVYICNTVIWLFGKILNIVLSVLPNSPFININTYTKTTNDFFGYLSWLIPIKEIIGITVLWLSCMLIYYIYSVVMRWIKLID